MIILVKDFWFTLCFHNMFACFYTCYAFYTMYFYLNFYMNIYMNIKILFLNNLLYLIFHVLVESMHTRFVFPGSYNFCILLTIYLVSCLSFSNKSAPPVLSLRCTHSSFLSHQLRLLFFASSIVIAGLIVQCINNLLLAYLCKATQTIKIGNLTASYLNKVQVDCINNSRLKNIMPHL